MSRRTDCGSTPPVPCARGAMSSSPSRVAGTSSPPQVGQRPVVLFVLKARGVPSGGPQTMSGCIAQLTDDSAELIGERSRPALFEDGDEGGVVPELLVSPDAEPSP